MVATTTIRNQRDPPPMGMPAATRKTSLISFYSTNLFYSSKCIYSLKRHFTAQNAFIVSEETFYSLKSIFKKAEETTSSAGTQF